MKILLLGGGLSNLLAAKTLAKENYELILLEQDSILGGLASSFKKGNKWIPKTYHHILSNEYLMRTLIKEQGFGEKLLWNDSAICFWFANKPFRLTSSLDILFFKPLSWKSRIDLIKIGLISYFKKDWKKLKTKNASEWLSKIVGEEVRKKLFEPLANIKFGSLSSVSAAWFGARLHEAAINKEKYAYLEGGFQQLIEKIADFIKQKGGKIYLNATVKKIIGKKVYVNIKGKQKIFEADKIISSIPPPELVKIAKLSNNKKQLLEKIKYQPMICMVCGSKQLLTKYYWNVFIEPKYSFGGIFHHTALYPKGGLDGEYIYYFFKYLSENDELYKKSELEIKNVFLKDAKKIKPSFEMLWTKVFKIKNSSPVFSFDYENIPIKLTDNIYLTGIYNEYPNTRTMNSAAKSGIKTAEQILKKII